MPRRNVPSVEDSLRATREALRNKRLAREMKHLRKCHPHKKRPPALYGEGPKTAVARGLLKMLGLFSRGLRNANSPVLREFQFHFTSLPAAFDGFRILHLSDFHFNGRPGFVEAACSLLDGVECDLCVMTGDFRFNLTASCRSVYAGMKRIQRKFRPEFGTLAVLGNNDMGDIVPGFRALEIRILMNESLAVSQGGQAIWIAGVDDPREFFCDSLPLALQEVPEGAFTILLAHSPEIIEKAAPYGVDLYLCGHTHGGQVCLPVIGPPYLNTRTRRRYASGKWRYREMLGYTTTGIGSSTMPIRFNCPPEAAIIELRRKP